MENKLVNDICNWIATTVKQAKKEGVVIGMSGGKDSFITAKLCAMAVGPQNVFGVIMPNGIMKDLEDAKTQCKLLNINYEILDIKKTYNAVVRISQQALLKNKSKLSKESKINIAPRIRMTTLYAIGQSLNYLVANTSNYSEKYIGYTTKWGDNVGDFSPLGNFTKSEVCKIGLSLGLPEKYVKKQPNDGLSGKSDEEKIGFTYEELDNYIRHNKIGPNAKKIEKKHELNLHKRKIATYIYKDENE